MKNGVHALFGLAFLIGCGGASSPARSASPGVAGTATPSTKGGVKAIGEAAVGDQTRCPVSGETFTVAADSPKTEYEGKTYYFCCPGCDKRFEENPKKYLGAGTGS